MKTTSVFLQLIFTLYSINMAEDPPPENPSTCTCTRSDQSVETDVLIQSSCQHTRSSQTPTTQPTCSNQIPTSQLTYPHKVPTCLSQDHRLEHMCLSEDPISHSYVPVSGPHPSAHVHLILPLHSKLVLHAQFSLLSKR